MGRNRFALLAVIILSAFIVSGCGTSQKKVQSEMSGIKTRVETLESRVESVESKQAEVERAAAEQAMAVDSLKTSSFSQESTNFTVKDRDVGRSARTKDIQQALKNAGYYDGKIDGVKGKGTRKAIKDFQRANGLKADGVVGPRTWELLGRNLSVQSAVTTGDEGTK